MTTLSENPLGLDLFSRGDAPTESQLLAYALARAGFPATVAIGREPAAIIPEARYALHLTAAVPVADLVVALSSLRGRSENLRNKKNGGPWAALLLSETSCGYRERLNLDADSRVVSIRRHFRTGPQRRLHLCGTVWTFHGPFKNFQTPADGTPWRTAKAIHTRARKNSRDLTRILLHDDSPESPSYFHGPRATRKPFYNFAKRLFDIVFSLFAIFITLPICLPIALLIKLADRGPIFFKHTREGLHGRPFGCLKFRTMVLDADALQQRLRAQSQVDGPQFKIERDPRVTRLGRFLRRSNIDELPQFWHVLIGQMSVVGPRPSPFDENQMCPAWREARLSVKPGITGLWQVSRSRQRGPTDFQEWIFFDTQYVERRGFWLDIRIILLTLKEMFGKGA